MKYSSCELSLFNEIHYILQMLQHICLIPLRAVQNIINGGFKAAKHSTEIVSKA